MIALSHPTGNVFVRALLEAFELAKLDYQFFTTLAFEQSDRWLRALPCALRSEAMRRSYNIPASRLRRRPWRELGRLTAGRFGSRSLLEGEGAPLSVYAIYCDNDRWVSKELPQLDCNDELTGVYAYEDAAAQTFTVARSRGIGCYYELPIAYWKTSRRLLDEEAERLPEWEPTLVGTRDTEAKLERKTMELSLADTVICPSQFVYRSLPEEVRLNKQCIVAEFGTPDIAKESPAPALRSTKLRVLFAGSMSQRKGLADVFAAMKMLHRNDIDLVVMGSPVVPMEFYRKHYSDFLYEPPRPHAAVIELMKTCDLLVLPSIVEGRALVQQEAMSCGLPIIVTANAGGEDLVEEGRTGFLVPIRSPQVLAERLEWCADHRSALCEMGEAARHKAATYTWMEYGRKILSALQFPESRDTVSPVAAS